LAGLPCLALLLLVASLLPSRSAQPLLPQPLLPVKAGDVLVFEGDSITYGQDESPSGSGEPINGAPQSRSTTPFPEYLGKLLGDGVTIINHGFPGDRTSEGLRRWEHPGRGDVYFIMYGGNDAGNFGHLPGGPLSVAQYAQNLQAIAARRLKEGAKVALLLPVPAMDSRFDAVLEPYRDATREVARRLALPVLDTPSVLRSVPERWVDGLHLSAQSNRAIAIAIKNGLIRYGT
jgi:lysophospholipase L1-like esterase